MSKTSYLHIRIHPDTKYRIVRAAEAKGKTLSEYVVETMYNQAMRDLRKSKKVLK